ncbi:TLC domain containing protein [Nitzschia inconspicua]|uniref:TLC domain containing protein n=1 Tax=Nitzschia inconspicua TaxID=303405 RepID=A0A9K3Q2T1_9STRA|nr:TLC domain containing protein [Nitzschia inconspicua]
MARPTLDVSAVKGTWSGVFLAAIQEFDTLTGAGEWAQSSRQVALVAAILLGTIRFFAKQRCNVNWYSLIHATITGLLSAVCVWLNFNAVSLTGVTEPLGAILCKGPLTSFHAMIPAITAGFGIFDIIEGFSHGMDFILHGLATFTVMAYFCEVGVPEIIVPMLMMEISTINLCLMRATFFVDHMVTVNIFCFVASFFAFRIVLCPYLWWGIFATTWEHRDNPESKACLPWHFKYVTFAFGMFFNCLNAYWFYKILIKFYRKMSGKEKIKEKNSLKDR